MPTQKSAKENKQQNTKNIKTAGPQHSKEKKQQKCTYCFVSSTRKNQKKNTGKTANNRNKYSLYKNTGRLNLTCPKGHLWLKTAQWGHLDLPAKLANGAKFFQPFQFLKKKLDQSEFFKTKSKQFYWARNKARSGLCTLDWVLRNTMTNQGLQNRKHDAPSLSERFRAS